MLTRQVCALCDRPGDVVCPACAHLAAAPSLPVPLDLDACTALFDYADARTLVTALKNRDRRDLVGWLAGRLAAHAAPPPAAVVTWAPTGARRRQARGFDQSELLARALARRWLLPCRALLRRDAGPAQAGRGAAARRRGPSFTPLRGCPPVVVLVDDVVTTGATLTAAARALRHAGASSVVAAVVARAPVRGVATRRDSHDPRGLP